MLPYFSFWPQPNGRELLTNGTASGTAFSYNNPKQSIREDFGTLRADYTLGDRDSLSAAYTIDDGNSLIPLADPLFGSYTTLRMQVASLQETHIFSPNVLNTCPRRLFARRIQSRFRSAGVSSQPASPSSQGDGPGGIVVNGGVTTTGLSGITSAGPNNAAGVWNRRNLFTCTDDLADQPREATRSARASGFSACRTTKTPRRASLGQATFTSLTTFLQGTVSSFPGGSRSQRTGLEKSLRRVVPRGRHQAAPQSHPPGGHPRTNSPPVGTRHSEGPPTTSLMPPACCVTAPRVGNSVFTAEQRHASVQRPRRPGVGSLRATERPPSARDSEPTIR